MVILYQNLRLAFSKRCKNFILSVNSSDHCPIQILSINPQQLMLYRYALSSVKPEPLIFISCMPFTNSWLYIKKIVAFTAILLQLDKFANDWFRIYVWDFGFWFLSLVIFLANHSQHRMMVLFLRKLLILFNLLIC